MNMTDTFRDEANGDQVEISSLSDTDIAIAKKIFDLLGNEIRIKILQYLLNNGESDTETIDKNVPSSSDNVRHQLQILFLGKLLARENSPIPGQRRYYYGINENLKEPLRNFMSSTIEFGNAVIAKNTPMTSS